MTFDTTELIITPISDTVPVISATITTASCFEINAVISTMLLLYDGSLDMCRVKNSHWKRNLLTFIHFIYVHSNIHT